MTLSDGLLSGYVRREEVIELPDYFPLYVLEELPISADMLKSMLETFLVGEFDSDGDGSLDAVTVGMTFDAIPAVLDGMAQP